MKNMGWKNVLIHNMLNIKRGADVHPEIKEGRSKKDSMKQFLIKERQ